MGWLGAGAAVGGLAGDDEARVGLAAGGDPPPELLAHDKLLTSLVAIVLPLQALPLLTVLDKRTTFTVHWLGFRAGT